MGGLLVEAAELKLDAEEIEQVVVPPRPATDNEDDTAFVIAALQQRITQLEGDVVVADTADTADMDLEATVLGATVDATTTAAAATATATATATSISNATRRPP